METKAILKYARISPQKAQLIANNIRNKDADSAENILKYSNTKAANLILKLLKSAKVNTKDRVDKIDNLIISKIIVSQGPVIKRRKIRSRGRADLIRRRTSHIMIVLSEKDKKKDDNKKNIKNIKSNKNTKIRNSKYQTQIKSK